MKVSVLASAKRHLTDGYNFYETQAEGLGTYFLDSLFADVDSLAFYGGIHPMVFGFTTVYPNAFRSRFTAWR